MVFTNDSAMSDNHIGSSSATHTNTHMTYGSPMLPGRLQFHIQILNISTCTYENDSAPVGIMKNSWNGKLVSGMLSSVDDVEARDWEESHGIGLPAISAKCFQRGMPLAAAPALEAAKRDCRCAGCPSFNIQEM
jgi:hypothetical protein